jgi:multidrug resistance efflux pump
LSPDSSHTHLVSPSHAEGLALAEHSEEIQDIITAVPAWIIRYGITLFFALLLALIACSWFIHYPDLVEVPLQLTAVNAPKSVNARVDGKLTQLLVSEGQSVRTGQPLAFVESTADHMQVLDFARQLEHLHTQLTHYKLALLPPAALAHYSQLGDIQMAYQTFEQAYTQYLAYQGDGYFPRKRRILLQEITEIESLNRNLSTQKQLYDEDLRLSQREFDMQRDLAQQHVISPADFRREESQLLSKRLPVKQAESTIHQNNMLQTAKQKELLELDRFTAEQRGLLLQALNTLRTTVESWKNRYILTAPTTGRVYFSTILEEKQTVATNQEVFYVAPAASVYYGEATVPQASVGKVAVGQKVILKFAGYPFEQYGAVRGQLVYLSQIPRETGFLAKVALVDGLVTTYGKSIGYRNGLSAKAAIVTEDSRLSEKIFYTFRRALAR